MQRTLETDVTFSGVGLHSGQSVSISVKPAGADHGIKFIRTDVAQGRGVLPAHWDLVENTPLCSRLINEHNVSVSTIEHLMAALAGCGLHNALIAVDGPEIPIMDGSAVEFAHGFIQAGITEQDAPLQAIRILKPVGVQIDAASAQLEPAQNFNMDYAIDFSEEGIGKQHKSMAMANGAFLTELSQSRTFCIKSQIPQMRASGLIKGGDLSNAVVFDGNSVLTPGGLRFDDEPVRHKMLDAMGDLALAGMPILGRYSAVRGGHAVTNALLRALFSDKTTYEVITCNAQVTGQMPGVGITRADIQSL